MPRRSLELFIGATFLLALIVGGWIAYQEYTKACCAFPDEPEPRPTEKLGLMTSLPIYWPLDADMEDIASGNAEMPWQRRILESRYELVPLDTLSPIPALSPDEPDTDPLAGLERLAVIQPRGLSPADNVALDDWVREGGQLLLVLDPMLTGDYDAPLGDPKRPVDTALIPPVVGRWGLTISFDPDGQYERRPLKVDEETFSIFAAITGRIEVVAPDSASCELRAQNIVAQCKVGAGHVTLMADATVFEVLVEPTIRPPSGDTQLGQLLRFAFP
ncbi:hypothetical protein ACI5KX_12715 [Erythrobacter sp. GH1-10]|uniref:hypothetical protein n=1 Tax=Erythrobacter sp. GH1-10 TaxID=3349334 RepID=UPI00387809A6